MRAQPARSAWQRACALTDLSDETPLHVELAGLPICLVRSGPCVYALRDECSHENVPLSEGEVGSGVIECWLHGSRFDLATGTALTPPATEPVPVYPVQLSDDGQVYVAVNGPPSTDSPNHRAAP